VPIPAPLLDFLVPPGPPESPEGSARREERLVSGVPHTMILDRDVSIVVLVPTGLAATWRDADPSSVVSASKDQVAPWTGTMIEPASQAPIRLLVRRGGAAIGSVPLVAGLRRRLADSGDPERGAVLDLTILGWELHAGTVRGPGDFGSRVELAWRRSDKAVDQFSTPPIVPHLVPRLPPEYRVESDFGLIEYVPLPRFTIAPRSFVL
jgi:hypothetical protein